MSMDYVDRHKKKAIEGLKEICKIPSVSVSGEGIRETVEYVEKELSELGCKTKTIETDGSPVVFGELEGEGNSTLIFYNHYDVQPPEPLDEWDSPPFKPEIRDGKLFARGAADNKGNIEARIWAVKSIIETKGKLPVNIKFVVEGEEEIGSPNFEGFVDENPDLLKGDGCIWESGGRDEKGKPKIILGLKGICYLELKARGANRDLHSSKGTIVPNPAWDLVSALNTLRDKNGKVLIEGFYENVKEPTEEELKAIEKIPFREKEKKERLGISQFLNDLEGETLKRKHYLQPACNICGLKSGWTNEGSKTVLPSKATAKVGLRLVPDQKPTEIEDKLRKHLDKHGFEDIEIEPAEGEEPARTPLDSSLANIISNAASEVYKQDSIIYPTSAGTGPIHAITKLGLPVVGIGVSYYDSRIHSPNENIRVEDYLLGIKHVIRIIEKF